MIGFYAAGAMGSGGGGGGSYNDLVAALGPSLWWRLEETTGSTASDSSGNGYDGIMSSGTFADSGISVAAPAGFAGIGRGVDMGGHSRRIRYVGTGGHFGASESSQWAVGLWLKGAASGSQYILDRGNDAAVLNGFVAGKVEFFATGYSGSNPRTGSQMDCGNTSPEFYVYRYDAGQWSGFRNGSKVFDVTRSFGLSTSVGYTELHETNEGQVFDTWVVTGASIPSDAQIAAMWDARNS